MSAGGNLVSVDSTRIPNGAGAAALLAAGIGSFMLPVLAIGADRVAMISKFMTFWNPTGPLSGVTTCVIATWLVVWLVLHRVWHKRNVALGKVGAAAVVLLLLGLLLTFPPVAGLI
jgi:hypothetical protein